MCGTDFLEIATRWSGGHQMPLTLSLAMLTNLLTADSVTITLDNQKNGQ
jgi:hypothetical protein